MARLQTFPAGYGEAIKDFSWACAVTGQPAPFADLKGNAFGGTFDEARDWLARQADGMCALVVILVRGDGMDQWLAEFPQVIPGIPVAGGAAARSPGEVRGLTFPAAPDVALFAIREGRWEGHALTAHRPAGGWFVLAGDDPRWFTHAGEVPLADILSGARREYGLSADDWDRVALTDREGIVYHLHTEGDVIVSGADLCASREVAVAVLDPQAVEEARRTLSPGDLVFGCAGLAGLAECGLPWADCGAFTALYGEIHYNNGTPRFSNLTLSVLHRKS